MIFKQDQLLLEAKNYESENVDMIDYKIPEISD